MELNKTLELLNTFAEDNKIQTGAVNLLETMVKSNVSADDAQQFCQEHFMSSNIADYYVKFYDYVVALVEAENKEPKDAEDTSDSLIVSEESPEAVNDVAVELQEINNTLKELVVCLKQLMS